MAVITNITTHSVDAIKRFLHQYKEKAKLNKLMEAFADEVQEIENALFSLVAGRALSTAQGAQLDLIGEIIDQERGSFDDAFYKILLKVKIGQNTSQGNAQKIIDIFKLLTEADYVHLLNLGNGSIQLNTTGTIAPEDVDFVLRNMERVVAGGVRIDHIVQFDPDLDFAFFGAHPDIPGGGFDNVTANAPGAGKFPLLRQDRTPFAFAGNDVSARGFSGIEDPIAGGRFVPLGGF